MAIPHFTPQQTYPRTKGVFVPTYSAQTATVTTATTPVTVTAAQILQGVLIVDCQDAGTITFPTAALLKAAIPAPDVGTAFELIVLNSGDTTLTVAIGSGGTLVGTATVATVSSKRLLFRFTNVTEGSEAYTVYSLGASSTY